MTVIQNRRAFIGAAAGVALAAGATEAFAQITPKVEYTVKQLPFDPSKMKGLSEKLLVSHHDNNYAGAVKRLNAITAQLASLDMATAPVFVVNGLKREELIAANSMIIHELYFDGLGGEGDPKGALAEAMARDFGSVARWKAEFAAVGRALGGGSGWVMLAWSPRDKRLVNTWAADHTMTLANGRPILALDMYEHAYAMDYGAKAAGYVDAFMQMVRWDNAAALYDKYSKEA
jgi:Fe-Mn family superoxide dismutase